MKKKFEKKSHNAVKTEGGPFGIFQDPFCHKNPKKLKGNPLRKKIPEKSLAMPEKTERGDPLVSSGIVCYAGNHFGSVPWANRYNLASF